MARQLLIDSIGFKLVHLQESEAGKGDYLFRGKFAQSDTPTANKRIYPRGLWERELGRLKQKIAEGKVFGELDHPEDGKTKLQRAAVLITDLSIDKQGQIIGGMKILNTSMGKEMKAIADGGGAIGVSSRGYGSVRMNEDGHSVVQDDFTLLTFDPVADPAEESAYPELERTGETEEPEAVDELAVVEPATEPEPAPAAQWQNTESIKIESKTIESKASEGNMDNAAVLELIRKTVKESVDALLAEKDRMIESLQVKLSSQAKEVTESKKALSESKNTIEKLYDVSKELGYGLYLQQHLGKHPKLKQIKESLGDLTLIGSLQDLQNKINVHVSEVTKISESEESAVKKLNESVSSMAKQLKLTEQKVLETANDRDEAIRIGLEHASALYLERRITGNPYQAEMRQRFRDLKEKTKASVDNLISEYKGRRTNESSDYHRVRRSLSHRPSDVVNDNLVEDHVRETKPFVEGNLFIDGQTFNMNEIKRLSGMK